MSDEGRMTERGARDKAEGKSQREASEPTVCASPDASRVTGRVVYSTAGRDVKRPFVIVGVTEEGALLIADGKLHPAAKPKRKNLRHLEIRDALFAGDTADDAAIREFLRSYEEQAR